MLYNLIKGIGNANERKISSFPFSEEADDRKFAATKSKSIVNRHWEGEAPIPIKRNSGRVV